MFNPDKPVQTRDGRKAEIVYSELSGIYPLLAIVTQEGGEVFDATYTMSGSYSGDGKSNLDLINIPETHVLWQNIGQNGDGTRYVQTVHRSRDMADKHMRPDRTECIRVEFKEGQFDE